MALSVNLDQWAGWPGAGCVTERADNQEDFVNGNLNHDQSPLRRG